MTMSKKTSKKLLKSLDFGTARKRIAPYIQQTPVSYDPDLSLYLKWENQQRTGSFKLRGALNQFFNLLQKKGGNEIITASSGNHGIAIAYAAWQFNLPARIFVPEYTSLSKVNKIRSMQAVVERIPGDYLDVEFKAKSLAVQRGAIYFSSYNDWHVICGAGTITLEYFEQISELKQLIIPLGGGALLSGIALAARRQHPDIRIIGVQAAASPYLYSQFHYGDMKNVCDIPTIMEGLSGPLEERTIAADLISDLCDDVLLINDNDVVKAVAYAYHTFGEIIEPSGAVGIAAVLTGKISIKNNHSTGTVVSGGNIYPEVHAALLQNS